MLSGIRIFSSDTVWRQILTDLNAVVLDTPCVTDLNLDDLDISLPISAIGLKALIIKAQDNQHILDQIFKRSVSLSWVQAQIVVALFQSGGMCLNDLKVALGYAPSASTHAVDTAIYQLRKMFGREFIINNNGVYQLGRV